jgi:tetratricopeptide (TPR) repeat protein
MHRSCVSWRPDAGRSGEKNMNRSRRDFGAVADSTDRNGGPIVALAAAIFAPCLLGMTCPVARGAEDIFPRASELLRQGKPVEAFSLLQSQEDGCAGDPSFDYVLGIAALESGRPDLATLAFERVLAVDPNYAGARVDIARAYFLLKDYTRARAELDIAATQAPPETARLAILKLQQSIEQALTAKKTVTAGYAEWSLGRDTNVNSSGTRSQITVPALGGLRVNLSPKNIGRHDFYSLLSIT